MRRSERSRKRRWLYKKAQQAFRSNPYEAGKALLDPVCNASLCVDQGKLDEHKKTTVSDPFYDVPLEALDGLPPAPIISKSFDASSLNYEDFEKLLCTHRNKSSPGLNAIKYIVYKKCSRARSYLFDIFKSCLRKSVVPV